MFKKWLVAANLQVFSGYFIWFVKKKKKSVPIQFKLFECTIRNFNIYFFKTAILGDIS